jgi:uncharacterized protein (TIGR02300 family)
MDIGFSYLLRGFSTHDAGRHERRRPRFSTLTGPDLQSNGGTLLSGGSIAVAKPELGTKRICASCGAKFYDLARDPIVCPKCGTTYQIVTSARAVAPAAAARAVAPVRATEEVDVPQPAEAEVISLEEADAEATGSKKKKPAAAAEGEEEEVEIATTEEDNTTFLEQDEEEASDVSDIIGEGIEEKEEET